VTVQLDRDLQQSSVILFALFSNVVTHFARTTRVDGAQIMRKWVKQIYQHGGPEKSFSVMIYFNVTPCMVTPNW
jgi:hypothetical protein